MLDSMEMFRQITPDGTVTKTAKATQNLAAQIDGDDEHGGQPNGHTELAGASSVNCPFLHTAP